MNLIDVSYAVFIALALCAGYFILLELLPPFFAQTKQPRKNPAWSLFFIVLFFVVSYAVSFLFSNLELGNRILHAFGGGFSGFLMYFLAVKDSRIRLNLFQFISCGVLVVLALGTANELFEFFLQQNFGIISAATVDDTWLDLASNTVGTIIAIACFAPFFKRTKLDRT